MAFSSVFVVGNSLRLRRWRPRPAAEPVVRSICSIRGPRAIAMAGSGSGDSLGRARNGAVRAGRMYRRLRISATRAMPP